MNWNLPIQLLILFTLQLSNFSQARHGKQIHPSAVVVGTVYCDTCFQDDFSRSSHFISGATVSVDCESASFKTEVKTDYQGQFKVPLPFSVSRHEKEIKGCQVRLLKSSEPYCAIASTATSSSIQLKSQKPGARVFSAGFFTFKPLKQPDLCNQQPSTTSSTKFSSQKSLPTNPDKSIARPQFFFPPFFFPPIFPSPPPAITVPLPPNPLQPPPLIPLPPNPLQPPSPPPFGIPTIPGLPGSSPSPPPFGIPRIPGLPGSTPWPPPFGLPRIPGLPAFIPSPPPPPPVLPIPFPPLVPFPPLPPVFPGVPPAKKVSP